jgi:outer membrane lipoprotein-sorting protein
MQSKTLRLSIAALILLAFLLGIHLLGGSIDGTSLAWADVVKEMNNYERYKCRQRVVREQGPQRPSMVVYHLNLSQRRQEVENGDIHIIDMRGQDAITVEMSPATKRATVTRLIGMGPRKDPDIVGMVKRFEQQSTERLGTKQVNGRTLQGFRHVPNEHNDFTVWVDPHTKLPVEIELKHTQRGQTIFMDEFEFDFDLVPADFSTEVPAGYEVQTIERDYRPVESKLTSVQELRQGLKHRAYTLPKLSWFKRLVIIQTVDPLMKRGRVFMTGIVTDDDKHLILNQSNTQSDYREAMMAWILKETLVIQTPNGTRLYTHPRGREYAQYYLEGAAQAKLGFFDDQVLGKERFARMIVLPNGDILGLSANEALPDERLQELVESLIEIKAE